MWVYGWYIFWFVFKYLLQRDRKHKCSVNLFLSLKNTPTFFTLPHDVPDELLFSIHASGSLAIYFLSTCVPISTWQSEPIAEHFSCISTCRHFPHCWVARWTSRWCWEFELDAFCVIREADCGLIRFFCDWVKIDFLFL